MVKPRFGARGGARHVAVMGHELVCIIYAAGPTQPVGVGLVSEWYAGDRGMVVLLVRRLAYFAREHRYYSSYCGTHHGLELLRV